jgi:hypothetical protein
LEYFDIADPDEWFTWFASHHFAAQRQPVARSEVPPAEATCDGLPAFPDGLFGEGN